MEIVGRLVGLISDGFNRSLRALEAAEGDRHKEDARTYTRALAAILLRHGYRTDRPDGPVRGARRATVICESRCEARWQSKTVAGQRVAIERPGITVFSRQGQHDAEGNSCEL